MALILLYMYWIGDGMWRRCECEVLDESAVVSWRSIPLKGFIFVMEMDC